MTGLKRFHSPSERGGIGPEPTELPRNLIFPDTTGYMLSLQQYDDLMTMLEWWKKQPGVDGSKDPIGPEPTGLREFVAKGCYLAYWRPTTILVGRSPVPFSEQSPEEKGAWLSVADEVLRQFGNPPSIDREGLTNPARSGDEPEASHD